MSTLAMESAATPLMIAANHHSLAEPNTVTVTGDDPPDAGGVLGVAGVGLAGVVGFAVAGVVGVGVEEPKFTPVSIKEEDQEEKTLVKVTCFPDAEVRRTEIGRVN